MALSRLPVRVLCAVSIWLITFAGLTAAAVSDQPATGWEYAVIYVDHANRTYSLDYRGERQLFHDYNAFVDALSGTRMFEGERKPDERMPSQVRHALRASGWRLVSAGLASQGTAEVSFIRRAVRPRPQPQQAEGPTRILPDDTDYGSPRESR